MFISHVQTISGAVKSLFQGYAIQAVPGKPRLGQILGKGRQNFISELMDPFV